MGIEHDFNFEQRLAEKEAARKPTISQSLKAAKAQLRSSRRAKASLSGLKSPLSTSLPFDL
jgi:hypothetical protein